MNTKKYSDEEESIIEKWGVPSDKDYDEKRIAYLADTGERVSSLMLAKLRAAAVEMAKLRKESKNRNYI